MMTAVLALAVGTGAMAAGPTSAGQPRFDGKNPTALEARRVSVVDGDTIKADIVGDDQGQVRIRTAGMQTMEQGECHYAAAKRGLNRILGKKVILKSYFDSQNVNRANGYNRLLRNLFTPAGVDVQAEMLRQGLALPYSLGKEILNEELYSLRAQEAARAGVGMFDTDSCGVGPSQAAQLRLTVHYNADGSDPNNLNGKFIRIRNLGTTDVSLARWRLRAAAHDFFELPPGAVAPAGGELKVRLGAGQSRDGVYFWNGNRLRFPVPGKSKYAGGGAYLFDPDGDVRAWSIYPCRTGCTDPRQGLLDVRVVYDPEGPDTPEGETVSFISRAKSRMDLSHLVLEIQNGVLELPRGAYIDPGETLTVSMGKGQQTRLEYFLGRSEVMLPMPPKGGLARMRTANTIVIACRSWGRPHC